MTAPSSRIESVCHVGGETHLAIAPESTPKPAALPRGFSKRRVVHISLGTDVGGMERLLVDFARFSDRSQFELVFLSLQRRGALADAIEALDYPVFAFDKAPGLSLGLVVQLTRRLRRLRPDVVHTHNTAGLVYGVTAAILARVPRVVHTRHGQRFQASNRQTALFRLLSRKVHQIVSVSNDGQRLSIAEGIDARRTRTIHNGIDLDRFHFAGPKSDGAAVLVARLSSEKDVATLIRAVGIANDRIGIDNPPLRLDIVGDGDQRASLEALTLSLGLEEKIRFYGIRRDIPQILAGASMFVLPSLTEGTSLTLLEAMARGLPVVACDVGGNPEVVRDGSTGLLVPAREPTSLAAAMLQLHQNPELAARYGRAGRERVEQEFCVRRMIEQYQTVYAGDVPR